MPRYVDLRAGDPAPWFRQRTSTNPSYALDTVGGRYIVLCFAATFGDEHAQAAVAAVRARPDIFDDDRACFFGVSIDPRDQADARVADHLPGYRFFWDFDRAAHRLYGAAPLEDETEAAPQAGRAVTVQARRLWAILDPSLRVLAVVPFAPDRSDIEKALSFLDALPPPSRHAGFEIHAPVLVLPNVFERELCDRLIGLYEASGGEESGFMREVDGKTVLAHDPTHKRRRDYEISDQALVAELRARFRRRVVPEILKVHQFRVTRMERYIVGCYTAEDRGHFKPHRDNTTKGTAHRRFAASVNLNDDFDGGLVSFPEYGPRGLRPPVGGALVFSCSLLHAVSPVTRGRRYAFLPFLYDDAAAAIREQNNKHLGEGVAAYRSGA